MKFGESLRSYLEDNNITSIQEFLYILDHSFDGIVLSDENEKIFYVNKALERLTGIDRKHFIGKTPGELRKEGMILLVKREQVSEELINIVHEGKTGLMAFITSTVFYYKGNKYYFSNYREVSELSNLQSKLLQEAKVTSARYYAELTELRNALFRSEKIVIKDLAMQKLTDNIKKIAPTDVTVCIKGESGAGKDVFAKLLHKMSNRAQQPFIHINCAAIPESLLESELFGYAKGAFTGALKYGKPGLLETADGGTAYLDEIGDLHLNLQAKLLKVLQDKEIYRIGGRKPMQLNVRIICATNQDLGKLIAEDKFREDLYYRINQIPITIPPLRERKEEIIHFANHFLQIFNQKYHTNKKFTLAVCRKLESYEWPGNIRELENLVERLVIITEKETITIADLPIQFRNSNAAETNGKTKLKDILDEVEKEVLVKTIKNSGSRKAAQILGIDYSTLKRKRKKYSI